MKFFLSSRYSRREELLGYAQILKNTGHEVTARWLYGEHEAKDDNPDEQEAVDWSLEDLNDINQCDIYLIFNDAEGSMRGGLFVEYGYALGTGKTAYLIGVRTNIFTYVVPHHLTFAHFYEYMLRNPDKFTNNQTAMELI